MSIEHSLYADWDAAYVIGALSASDRREYEEHLDDCADCRHAVAEMGPTIGLLGRLSAADAVRIDEALAEHGPAGAEHGPAGAVAADGGVAVLVRGPDPEARTGLVSLLRERRRHRRGIWIAAAAAAVLLVAAVAVPVTLSLSSRPTASFVLEDVAGVPLTASVRLTDVAWGTRIELDCLYPAGYTGDVPDGGWTYGLTIVGTDGSESTVSTWRAQPGTSARLSAGSALEVSGIGAVEIRAESGAVLMRYELGAG